LGNWRWWLGWLGGDIGRRRRLGMCLLRRRADRRWRSRAVTLHGHWGSWFPLLLIMGYWGGHRLVRLLCWNRAVRLLLRRHSWVSLLLGTRGRQLLRAGREAPLRLHCRLVGRYFGRYISHVRWLSTLEMCRARCTADYACLLAWVLSLLYVLARLFVLALLCVVALLYV
jgi:hypothetical protein